jgi:hypothetical protein
LSEVARDPAGVERHEGEKTAKPGETRCWHARSLIDDDRRPAHRGDAWVGTPHVEFVTCTANPTVSGAQIHPSRCPGVFMDQSAKPVVAVELI